MPAFSLVSPRGQSRSTRIRVPSVREAGSYTRLIAMVIGLTGVLLTGLIAAIGVRALQVAAAESVGSSRRSTVVAPGNSEERAGGREL